MSERLQADGNLNINEFFELVKRVWDTTQEGLHEKYNESVKNPNQEINSIERPVQIYEAFPSNSQINNDLPIVTYMATRKSISKMGERKPRVRSIINNPKDGRAYKIMGQRFDYDVIFEIWSDTNQDSDRICNNFEEFMFMYTGLFKKQGVAEILFEEAYINTNFRSSFINPQSRTIPSYLENRRSRALVYKVTIEKLTHLDIKTIEEINVKHLEK